MALTKMTRTLIHKNVTSFDPTELFKSTEEDGKFFPNYSPPKQFKYREWYLISTYQKTHNNAQDVEVFEARLPQRLFIVSALPARDEIKQVIEGFELQTGALEGIVEAVANIANLISRGQVQKVWHTQPRSRRSTNGEFEEDEN